MGDEAYIVVDFIEHPEQDTEEEEEGWDDGVDGPDLVPIGEHEDGMKSLTEINLLNFITEMSISKIF